MGHSGQLTASDHGDQRCCDGRTGHANHGVTTGRARCLAALTRSRRGGGT
ncbi:hypothetical protein I553_0302 [Mycobacterium xenopi 4042]|uniref:Uncharacterized protein n=1 Tax=Mycobacterium xenopi 4042 TaxID=1299334 RepID=X7YI84_MYCXE|nr:hypothetical protein I553_0302 [Mycobacterium xenopi 4042]